MAPFISEANEIGGVDRGANGGRCRATQGDVQRRLVQSTGASGDGGRRQATVRLRLTSEGSLARTQLRPAGHPRNLLKRQFLGLCAARSRLRAAPVAGSSTLWS